MNKVQKRQFLDMNNNIDKQEQDSSVESTKGISRKEAIKKMGKYAAVTAIGSYIILNPMKAQAQSSNPTGPGGEQWSD